MMNRPLYDSKALTLCQWDKQRNELVKDGWEYRGEVKNGVVYLRKHISGDTNDVEMDKWFKEGTMPG